SGDDAEFAEFTPFAAREAPIEVSLDKLRDKNKRIKPDIIPFFELFSAIQQPGLTSSDRATLRTEISLRLSLSMACITLGLIGIPLGITAQRRETSVGFAMSLIVGIAYFMMITVAKMMRENSDAVPSVLVWIPNILFIIIGVRQFKKLNRK
ncbi:MAG: LptF/LptG family permease, partial [Verrucomicrobiales bacterium]|nr:LptF/LptG family permease [Verrucomicrobiales bacterium]